MSSETNCCAVTVTGRRIWLGVDADDDAPVEIAAQSWPHPLPEGYAKCLPYLEGVHWLLEFGCTQGWTTAPCVVQLDHLLAYNVLTRYLANWELQGWRTSRGTVVPAQGLMRRLLAMQRQYHHLQFHNVSPGRAPAGTVLRRLTDLIQKKSRPKEQTPLIALA